MMSWRYVIGFHRIIGRLSCARFIVFIGMKLFFLIGIGFHRIKAGLLRVRFLVGRLYSQSSSSVRIGFFFFVCFGETDASFIGMQPIDS